MPDPAAPGPPGSPQGGTHGGTHGRLWQFRMGDWRWTHVDLSHDAHAAGLAAEGWLPGDAQDLLRDPDDTPRLEVAGGVAMGVMPDTLATNDGAAIGCWRFVMRDDAIVTAQTQPTRNLVALGRACRAERPPASPAELVDAILCGFAVDAAQRAAALDHEATELEDTLLDGHSRTYHALGQRLGRVRREATRLQRVVAPIERLTRDDVHDLPGWTGSRAHELTRRKLVGAVEELRALSEHGRALQDELAARQTEAGNRTLNTLSILSAVLLPPTLVTGFFGMNTDGLPFKEGELGTVYAACIAACSVAITLFALLASRRRG